MQDKMSVTIEVTASVMQDMTRAYLKEIYAELTAEKNKFESDRNAGVPADMTDWCGYESTRSTLNAVYETLRLISNENQMEEYETYSKMYTQKSSKKKSAIQFP